MSAKIKCCWHCREREVGCHSYCERYSEERKEQDRYNDLVNAEKRKSFYESTISKTSSMDRKIKKRK